MEVVRDEGADLLARCLANMSDKESVVLIAVEFLAQRTSYLEMALCTDLSLQACRKADNGEQRAYENILDLPGAAEAHQRRSTIEAHSEFSEVPHLRSSIPHPKTDFSKNQIASR